MATSPTLDSTDTILEQMKSVLDPYLQDHPSAQVDLYRQTQFSVRLRVIDPAFQKLSRYQRHEIVWSYLDQLPEEVVADFVSILLLTPKEAEDSIPNMEFESGMRIEHSPAK